MRAMYPVVSGDNFPPTANTRYSAWLNIDASYWRLSYKQPPGHQEMVVTESIKTSRPSCRNTYAPSSLPSDTHNVHEKSSEANIT
jgi:hypothetical protein